MRKGAVILAVGVVLGVAGVLLLREARVRRYTYEGRAVKSWVLQLHGPAASQREAAVAAFKSMGSNAAPELLRLLESTDAPFLKSLRSLLPQMPPVLRPLALRIAPRIEASFYRLGAAQALGVIGPEVAGASQALESRMRDREPGVAAEAALALTRVNSGCVGRLQKALRDQEPNARYAAAYALGCMGGEAVPAVPELARLLEDSDPRVRATARGSLQQMGLAAVPELVRCVAEEKRATHDSAVEILLATYPSPVIPAPRAVNPPGDRPELQLERAHAIRRLSSLATNDLCGRILVGALVDPSPLARLAAVESLERVREPGVILALIGRLQDDSADVRARAAVALGLLGPSARPALHSLRQLAGEEPETVRRAARNAIAQIEPATAK